MYDYESLQLIMIPYILNIFFNSEIEVNTKVNNPDSAKSGTSD